MSNSTYFIKEWGKRFTRGWWYRVRQVNVQQWTASIILWFLRPVCAITSLFKQGVKYRGIKIHRKRSSREKCLRVCVSHVIRRFPRNRHRVARKKKEPTRGKRSGNPPGDLPPFTTAALYHKL